MCHSSSKPGNELVYFCNISRGRSLASGFYGQDNIANTHVWTCFHPVHLLCFIQMSRNSDSIACPLCGSPSNSIIPLDHSLATPKLTRICRNILTMSMIQQYQNYDI